MLSVPLRVFLVAVMPIFLIACEPTNLYIAHQTVIGLDAAANTERTAGHLTFGYDRNFVTLVPKTVEDGEQGREAMSVLSCSEVTVDGILLSGFVEYLATGRAARNYANRLVEGTANENGIFKCFNDN